MPSASQREVANAVFTSFSFTDLSFCWEHLLTELQNFVNPIILLQNSEDRKMTQSMWMLEIKSYSLGYFRGVRLRLVMVVKPPSSLNNESDIPIQYSRVYWHEEQG